MQSDFKDPYSNSHSWDMLDGVECDAVNCCYNQDGSVCTADHIKVGTTTACCSGDTLCDTFKSR
ncbi:MAG: DUF1540 domain-containing protein [Oscillospiraceae bacterium]|nr:DUF1540 domain-containing protein [Oscillospiraceae bacterium]